MTIRTTKQDLPALLAAIRAFDQREHDRVLAEFHATRERLPMPTVDVSYMRLRRAA